MTNKTRPTVDFIILIMLYREQEHAMNIVECKLWIYRCVYCIVIHYTRCHCFRDVFFYLKLSSSAFRHSRLQSRHQFTHFPNAKPKEQLCKTKIDATYNTSKNAKKTAPRKIISAWKNIFPLVANISSFWMLHCSALYKCEQRPCIQALMFVPNKTRIYVVRRTSWTESDVCLHTCVHIVYV